MSDTTSLFTLAGPLAANELHPSDLECPCSNPDDQYLMEVDAGTVYLTHKACGKQPRGWLDGLNDAISLDRIPVTLHWHDGRPVHPEDDDNNSYGWLTINDRAVMHKDVPYLVGRDYTDHEGAVWRITDSVDAYDHPMVYLLPEGAGERVPLGEVVSDFGPLTLVTVRCACEQHLDNESCLGPAPERTA